MPENTLQNLTVEIIPSASIGMCQKRRKGKTNGMVRSKKPPNLLGLEGKREIQPFNCNYYSPFSLPDLLFGADLKRLRTQYGD